MFFNVCMKASDKKEKQRIKLVKYSVYFLHIYLIRLDPKTLEVGAGVNMSFVLQRAPSIVLIPWCVLENAINTHSVELVCI